MKRTLPLSTWTKLVFSSAVVCLAAVTGRCQPTITSVFPDGSHMFQPSGNMSFSAKSPLGITNIVVQLTVTTLPGVTYLEFLNSGNGLTLTGTANNQSVSAALTVDNLSLASRRGVKMGVNPLFFEENPG
jgi:hypothetical protein